jgi:hypothetical protein
MTQSLVEEGEEKRFPWFPEVYLESAEGGSGQRTTSGLARGLRGIFTVQRLS